MSITLGTISGQVDMVVESSGMCSRLELGHLHYFRGTLIVNTESPDQLGQQVHIGSPQNCKIQDQMAHDHNI
jgi:hypothetical protein